MKSVAAVTVMLLLLCGCGQQKSQVGTMIWPGDATNCQLSLVIKGSVLTTNVTSLNQASDFLGQYGWQFASENTDGGNRAFYMKRQYKGDDVSTFALMPAPTTATK